MTHQEPLEDFSYVDTVEESGKLKEALNEAIWMYAPAATTLGVAEDAAVTALSIIYGAKYKQI